MKTVDLTIINTKTGSRQSISVQEPVDDVFLKDNALKRFGLNMRDLEVLSEYKTSDFESQVLKAVNTTNLVFLLVY